MPNVGLRPPVAKTLNPANTDEGVMPDDLRERIMRVLFYVGMAMGFTGILGEVLGWWGELGVVLTIGGFVLGLVSVGDVNGRRLLAIARPLPATLGHMESTLGRVDERLGSVDRNTTGLPQAMAGIHAKQDHVLALQDQAMDDYGQMLALQEDVRDLLDERLPRR